MLSGELRPNSTGCSASSSDDSGNEEFAEMEINNGASVLSSFFRNKVRQRLHNLPELHN